MVNTNAKPFLRIIFNAYINSEWYIDYVSAFDIAIPEIS